MVVLVWNSIPKKWRDEPPVMAPVEPCGNSDEHSAHWHFNEGVKVCHGVENKPTAYFVCQEAYGPVTDVLPCKHKESGGYQCERQDPHEDGHWFSQHTIRHIRAGNGHSCETVERFDGDDYE